MAVKSLRGYRLGAVGVVLLLLLLLTALHLMSGAIQDSEQLSDWFIPLLLFTIGGLIALVFLTGVNLFRLWRGYRQRTAGSRLTVRMVVLFVLLSLTPVSVVYFYSLQFLIRGIDSWLDVKVDTAMDDALSLSRASLDLHKRVLLRFTRQMLGGLQDVSKAGLALSLGDLRATSGATEMTLYDRGGQGVATSNVDPGVLVPEPPDMGLIQQVLSGKDYAGIVPYKDSGELHINCVTADERGLVLQVFYPLSTSVASLSDKVQVSYEGFRERAYLRDSIKFSFTLTLSLVLSVGVFAAILVAVFTARRMVEPVREIAAATRAVAEGDYGQQLPVPRFHDELSFLVASFNSMTRRISQARDLAERSQAEVAAQHAYLETILGRLSSGVMALSHDGMIKTANAAAEQILRVPAHSLIGQPLEVLQQHAPQLAPFVEVVQRSLESEQAEWRDEVLLYRSEGRQLLLCARSRLVIEDGSSGYVVLFEDITELAQAQRNAAWGEVARRLAHEIKNPLTPIQLAAERLQRKLLGRLDTADREVLERSTQTIVHQVEAMKSMVNAFSDYAKPSRMQAELILLDRFLADVLGLYDARQLQFEAGAEGTRVEADGVRLRQVVHNLVKNAQEAVASRDDGWIHVTTTRCELGECTYVQIKVADNGPGFSPELEGRMFEPYVTNKGRGTGLGLAIVKKIVEEHGGAIEARNVDGDGAEVLIRLPILDESEQPATCAWDAE